MSLLSGGKISQVRRLSLFKRWVIVYKHDKSPVDGGVFIHKPAAEKFLAAQHNKLKLEVKQFNLSEI
jgi:hypothetical protein